MFISSDLDVYIYIFTYISVLIDSLAGSMISIKMYVKSVCSGLDLMMVHMSVCSFLNCLSVFPPLIKD